MNVLDYLIENREMLSMRWDRNVNVPDYLTGEDIFQDMAEKFLMNPTEFDNEDECAKWVQVCAVNWIMDQKRKETGNIRREVAHLISQASGLEALDDVEGLKAVRSEYHHCLNLLKKVQDGRSTVGVIEA